MALGVVQDQGDADGGFSVKDIRSKSGCLIRYNS